MWRSFLCDIISRLFIYTAAIRLGSRYIILCILFTKKKKNILYGHYTYEIPWEERNTVSTVMYIVNNRGSLYCPCLEHGNMNFDSFQLLLFLLRSLFSRHTVSLIVWFPSDNYSFDLLFCEIQYLIYGEKCIIFFRFLKTVHTGNIIIHSVSFWLIN